MNTLMKLLLFFLYLALWPVGLVRHWLGVDDLQLRPPPPEASYWIVRGPPPAAASYFSEASTVEGVAARNGGGEIKVGRGAARFLAPLFLTAARLFAPPRQAEGRGYAAGAEREKGIPDEVYTLW